MNKQGDIVNYTKLILSIVLACNFASVKAENKPSTVSQGVVAKVGPVAEKAGRVAKVGAYGALAGVTGAAAAVMVAATGLLCLLYSKDHEEFSKRAKHEFIANRVTTGAVAALMITSPLSAYVFGKLALYFARKTKQAAEELKAVKK